VRSAWSARAAARQVGTAPAGQRDRALAAMATALRERAPAILAANRQDLADGRAAGLAASFIDRLALDEARWRRSPRP
jgi:glutamate-5-semialdehyde dehydrogenase